MVKLEGWLFDLYPDPQDGHLALWLIGLDGGRYCLRQEFPVTFYAAGPRQRLRALWSYLESRPVRAALARTERRDLFSARPLTVMEIRVERAAEQPRLFKEVEQRFPDLDYYDADIPITSRYAALYDVFPLARCRVAVDGEGWVREVEPLDSRWALDSDLPPLRILSLEPDSDPARGAPTHLLVGCGRYSGRFPLHLERPLLVNLGAVLRRFDPDLILSNWGDTWLLPDLLRRSHGRNDLLPLNRDDRRRATRKPERTYHAYGQVVHRGQQIHLHGRWHIDRLNAMMFADYGLEGIFELARVSGLPVQVAARNSPGAGITSMQMITALRRGVLVPYRKQQTEYYKTALDLIDVDRGGLVYQPITGLHQDVAEIDFVSMYPSIIRAFGISPETSGRQYLDPHSPAADLSEQGRRSPEALRVGEAWPPEAQSGEQGLLPETLSPLLNKRIAIKERLSELHPRDCRCRPYKARASALKWLLVVCFGYTGYKNAKFGRIESHQAITACARDALLKAKEAAEALGFTVLHLYVDGLWVKKPGARRVEDFRDLLDEIAARTGLPVALDGIYNWIAFLPSRQDEHVPVANRYFGVFQSGEIKVRGIEARRRDTPKFVAETQMEMLELLGRGRTEAELRSLLPQILALLRARLADLRAGRLKPEQLLVRQKLSRALCDYRVPSPAARAAGQLEAAGRTVRAGQYVRFIYQKGEPGVMAWDLPGQFNPRRVDIERYSELLVRAASSVVQPLGVDEEDLRRWLSSGVVCSGQQTLAWPDAYSLNNHFLR